MGVKNFWQLIESTGRPVNMNKGLEGKVLAIDISIWLHQAAKGMRDRQNPHILLLLHRICKLLHFKIKPIFVFDGGIPELKRQTLAERRQRRELAENKVKEAKNKIQKNYLKMIAIQQLRGEQIELTSVDDRERDLFELPDTHLRSQLVENDDNEDDDDDDDDEVIENNEFEPITKLKQQRTTRSNRGKDNITNYHYVLPNINEINDDALNNLPAEMQHEILTDMKESLKRNQRQIEDMPQKSDDFSNYQVQKLLKQNMISQKILSINKVIKRQKFDIPLEVNDKLYAGKLASDASTQYILIKSDATPVSLPRTSSSSSSSVTRKSTNDFCADNLMNRDPVVGLVRQRNTTIQYDSPIKINDEQLDKPSSTEKSHISTDSINDNNHNNNNEQIPLELSFEDQDESINEKNSEKSITVESSSDSDDSDFIEVPTIPKQSEPILLAPLFDEDTNPTNSNNTSYELIELDNADESSHNSTAIEDIQHIINSEPDIKANESSSISQLESFDQIQTELIDDTAAELIKARENERLTTTLTDTMHEDTKYLLRLFGIPYVISPTEAEAQCAYLDLSNQCDGVITDDSDVWLFGASHVYRHFFRQDQMVEYYDLTMIENQLGFDRETMIAIGMIVGSDYTKGIPNAGIMTALEILQEFHGNCMERLEKFRRWWKKAQRPGYKTDSKILKHLKNLQLFEGFPNKVVYDAYITPRVDYDQSKFTWAMPQLPLLREFIGSKLKWDKQKIDDMILPVIKRMNTKEIQSRIDSFFTPYSFSGTLNKFKKNTRLHSAIDLLKQKSQQAKDDNDKGLNLSENHDDDDDDNLPIPKIKPSQKRKRTKATKLMNNVLDVVEKTKRRSKITSPVLSDDDT